MDDAAGDQPDRSRQELLEIFFGSAPMPTATPATSDWRQLYDTCRYRACADAVIDQLGSGSSRSSVALLYGCRALCRLSGGRIEALELMNAYGDLVANDIDLAVLRAQIGDVHERRALLERALPASRAALIQAYVELGEVPLALRLAESADAGDDADGGDGGGGGRELHAQTLIVCGQIDRALALVASSSAIGARLNHAICRIALGEHRAAIALLLDVLGDAPGHVAASAHIAIAYALVGEPLVGIGLVEAAIRRDAFAALASGLLRQTLGQLYDMTMEDPGGKQAVLAALTDAFGPEYIQ